MGMAGAVDIFGLPVYKTTKTTAERVGDEIRIVHGYEMMGQTVWTHIVIMTVTDLIVESSVCRELAMRLPDLVRLAS